MSHRIYTKEDLLQFKPKFSSFVGIDSDGCVFPTMEIKQKQCFHKLIISHWHLEKMEARLREAAEFVNLYSKWRGQNRFVALDKMFDLLRERETVRPSGATLPDTTDMKAFIASGTALSHDGLKEYIAKTNSEALKVLLAWSVDVNAEIARTVKKIAPFKWATESLEEIRQNSDAICVSQTPTEALVREWEENSILDYVAIIAGQELGTKAEHIEMATKGRYPASNILMIGDAPGDRKAAKANRALFFPINPGHEEASWECFCKEAYDKFLTGTYAGEYEQKLIAEFDALLPGKPAWKSA